MFQDIPLQDIPLVEEHPSKGEIDQVPHPSHRHAAPSAPWPWIDIEDGLFFWLHVYRPSSLLMKFTEDLGHKQLETIEPPVPKPCDHDPADCHRCWTRYPISLFPNWTERQVRKAKIYDAVHNYPINKPCICYRVDVNDQGFFTDAKEMIAKHGDEDRTWVDMIYEQVGCSPFFDTWSLP